MGAGADHQEAPEAGLPQINDDELRAMWRLAGGRFYGPRVETGAMPESDLLPFLRGLVMAERAALSQHRAQVAPFGWAIVDKQGCVSDWRARIDHFFSATQELGPFTQEDVNYRDRDLPGLAPHRLVVLHAAPPLTTTGGKAP